jgi:hypothetical protein
MPKSDRAWTEHELKRWMRPDAHRFLRSDWRRFWKPGHENDPLNRLYESIERKYSLDQPRVPAGSREGGQWTREAGDAPSGGVGNSPDTAQSNSHKLRTQVAARISPQRRSVCEEQYRNDTFICNIMGMKSCWGQAAFRLSQCLIGGYVPPLYH